MKFTEYIESFPKMKQSWDAIPQPLKILFEINVENYKKTELGNYTDFLVKEGYCDTDVYSEQPTALSQFLKK